jgi:hypothetical protein
MMWMYHTFTAVFWPQSNYQEFNCDAYLQSEKLLKNVKLKVIVLPCKQW